MKLLQALTVPSSVSHECTEFAKIHIRLSSGMMKMPSLSWKFTSQRTSLNLQIYSILIGNLKNSKSLDSDNDQKHFPRLSQTHQYYLFFCLDEGALLMSVKNGLYWTKTGHYSLTKSVGKTNSKSEVNFPGIAKFRVRMNMLCHIKIYPVPWSLMNLFWWI